MLVLRTVFENSDNLKYGATLEIDVACRPRSKKNKVRMSMKKLCGRIKPVLCAFYFTKKSPFGKLSIVKSAMNYSLR